MAGEELHGLCFLLEKVEITEDCLGGTGNGNAAAVPPSSAIDGKSGDGSVAYPVVSSVAVDEDGAVLSSTTVKSVDVDVDGVDASGGVPELDVMGGENDTDDNASVGKGSVKSGTTGSNTGGRREPRQVRAFVNI